MANQSKTPQGAEVIEDIVLVPNRPEAGMESPTGRFITVAQQTFPIAFSRRNPATGQIFDYVRREKEVEARILNKATGVLERTMVLAVVHRKYPRPGTGPTARPIELVDYEG
jgi:hypothetical protein